MQKWRFLVDDVGERIPLTIAGTNEAEGTVKIIFQVVGGTTNMLNHKQAGEYISDFVGPLGKATELEGLKKVCIVGGGAGCAIVLPIAERLKKNGAEVTSIVGFRNQDLVILEDEFKACSDRFVLMTDDGSAGGHGLVTEPLKQMLESGETFDKVIAIGPIIMMKFVVATVKPFGTPVTVSMNPVMVSERNKMPQQDAAERIKNFGEVALGYTMQMAKDEASRCIGCKNRPCVSGCPVGIKIPDFIKEIKEERFEEAYKIIAQDSSFPAVCGRVCPQESQCESKCTLGIKFEPVAIGCLERFVADWNAENAEKKPADIKNNGHRVAVVGSGPSGLTCAGDLAKKGYEVTVFEALHKPGGVMVYGIPEFRLPKSIVDREIESLKEMNVRIETNVVVGKTVSVDELFEEGFEAIYIASGAGLPKFLGIEGEALKGVLSANEFLTRANLMKAFSEDAHTPIIKGCKTVVVGGGNVAMDAARTARRMGADVSVIYRRSMDEIPARKEEVEHAIEEGIEFITLANPVKIIGYNNPDDRRDPKNGFVQGVECERMELGEPDAKGRRTPHPISGSEFLVDAKCVILALGTMPNLLIRDTTEGLETKKAGEIIVDESGLTSRKGVYAGGDAVTGAATVILAMGAGKTAAKSIDEALLK